LESRGPQPDRSPILNKNENQRRLRPSWPGESLARSRQEHIQDHITVQGNREISPSKDSIKAAEDLALAAFASGLKLAAAFGTVAAKTTSLALASIATGADKFSELVKQEALKSQKAKAQRNTRKPHTRGNKRTSNRE